MKICLIVPPSTVLSKERTFPHLGILSVASSLREHGHSVHHVDLSGVTNFQEAIRTYVGSNDTSVFGLTATSVQLPTSVLIRDEIKSLRPDARIILGGPHGTLTNAGRRAELRSGRLGRASKHLVQLTSVFDTVVAGDGESAILRCFTNPEEKLVDADDPKSELWLSKSNLDQKPLPARDLLDLESYDYKIDGVPATTMIAQLGCPYPCGFCGGRNSPSLRQIRIRNVDSVIAELRHIYETYGIRGVMFYDDELNVNREMLPLMRAITNLGDELGVEWRLRGFVKANLFNLEQAVAMYRAGFREILVGFESGSPRILRNINKRSTLEENTRCVEFARKAGLRVKALMSIGHPGESEDTIRETEEWLYQINPDSFDLTRITVYPGTPYFDEARPHSLLPEVWTYEIHGDRLHAGEVDYFHNFIYYKGDRGDRMGLRNISTFTDYLSSEDMARLKDEMEDRLREKLGQPYQVDVPGISYEHSMGMGLPENILRKSE